MAAASGRGNKYAVLDPTDGPEVDTAGPGPRRQRRPSASERRIKERLRFVYACAIFASLNAVLLGYGEFSQCRGQQPRGSVSTGGTSSFLMSL
jgi:hypothetical protein